MPRSSPFAVDSWGKPSIFSLRRLQSKRILFDGVLRGDYSLAIVNRLLLQQLVGDKLSIDIYSDEASVRDDADLMRFPELRSRLLDRYPADKTYDIHLRNTWPPRAYDMRGRINAYVCFAWEEADIPASIIREFNRYCHCLMVTSTFVEDAFRTSGLNIPVFTVGNGCDHIEAAARPRPSGTRTLLHVSSCFPRKGVDVLIKAFSATFDSASGVELVIKTFDNPHNTVDQDVGAARAAYPDAAPIKVVKQHLAPAELGRLIGSAAALVAPSRGEGFGLPLAEAMMLGVPVVTTAYGGQVDFCRPDTSWLVDYTLAASRAHVTTPFGVWAEPSEASLAAALTAVLEPGPEVEARSRRAVELLRRHFTWAKVADRVKAVLARLGTGEATAVAAPQELAFRIDLVSSWQQICGIATYAADLFATQSLSPRLARVLARTLDNEDRGVLGRAAAEVPFERVWGYDFAGVKALAGRLGGLTGDVLWFQHHPGFWSASDMLHLRDAITRTSHRVRAITLHNARDLDAGKLRDWIDIFAVVFVHTPQEAEIVSSAGHRNVVVVPHGVHALPTLVPPGTSGPFTVGTFGFLFPHKGVARLVEAVAMARRFGVDVRLKLLTCVRPERKCQAELARVRTLVKLHGLEEVVEGEYGFLDADEVLRRLRECSLLAFLYDQSSEGATGAGKIALAAGRPILASSAEVLRDLHPVSHVLTSLQPALVAEALVTLAEHAELRDMFAVDQRQLIDDLSFDRMGERYHRELGRALEKAA